MSAVLQLPRRSHTFVEEQAHSSRRDADGSALSLGRVGQACADVIGRELREIGQDLGLGHSAGQLPQDVAHGYTGTADARLSEPDGRIEADAVHGAHGLILGSPTPNGKEAVSFMWVALS